MRRSQQYHAGRAGLCGNPPATMLFCRRRFRRTLRYELTVGLAHAQIATIHPFLDGNGRVGRPLITFLLCEKGVLRKPVLYLFHSFRKHRRRYYELLQATRDHGESEEWLSFFLAGITEVSAQAADTVCRILALREQHRANIASDLGRSAGNGHRVLEHLYKRPILSVNDVGTLIKTTYPAANDLVSRLEALGILEEMTGQARNRRFRYAPYIRLFNDERPDAASD